MNSFWRFCLARFEQELPPQQYRTWIKPLRPQVEGSRLTLVAPNRFVLQWIRDNVAAFGGDPNRIMIHGESGGGGKIGTLLGMPKASGLFQRAILQSGTANRLPTRDRAAELAGELLAALQIPKNQVRRIQEIPADAIIAAASKLETPGAGPRRGFVPTVGTVDLPLSPLDAVANGSARIPIMLGCTKHEMALMLAGAGTDPRTVTAEQLQGRVKAMIGDKSQALLDGYRANHPDYTPGDLLVRVGAAAICGTDRPCRSLRSFFSRSSTS